MELKIGKDSVIINDFDELEVYKIAMRIELDGEKFYKSVISLTDNPKIKRTFQRLAEDEQRHFETFNGLFQTELRARGIDPASMDREEGLFDYIDTGIFTKNTSAKSVKDAVMDGEIAELRSILFYKELLSNTKNDGGRRALSDMIEEENMHYNILKSWEGSV